MFERLQQRADEAGRRTVEAVAARIAAQTALPPDVKVSAELDRVVLEGRALRRRMIDDPRLRRIGR